MGSIVTLMNCIVILLMLVTVALLVFIFLMRKGKIKMKKNEDEIDYTYIKKKDVKDYIKFDAVIQAKDYMPNSNKEDGVIVMDGHNRFVAGIEVKGFNFYNASVEVQASTIAGMENLIEVFKSPIQFRQSTKKVDLEDKVRYYRHKGELLKDDLQELNLEIVRLHQKMERYSGDAEALKLYAEKEEEIKRQIVTKEWQANESKSLENYITTLVEYGALEYYQCYFFEWIFDPMLYNASELSREEIYQTACNELETVGNIYIDSLRRSSVSGRRMSKRDILEEMRAHNQPLTSRDYPFEDFWQGTMEHSMIKVEG